MCCDADTTATIALAGDEQLASADAVVVNFECCISDGGTPFPDPVKRFFFRAPPVAAERLAELGVDAVTLANNHALDYGAQALLDSSRHLERAGVAAVGAGADDSCARVPLTLRGGPLRLRVVAFSDHPRRMRPPPGNRESPTSTFAPGCRTGREPRHDRDRTATRCSSRRTGGPTWSARR